MTTKEAHSSFGENFIGPAELTELAGPFSFSNIQAPEIPFSKKVLEKCAPTHVLIFAPSVPTISINWFREKFGMDPDAAEPCMYNQDWYTKENFANVGLDGKWHLIAKDVREDVRAKQPDEIESLLSNEQFPNAALATFTFFVWFLLRNETLWKHDFVWCSDRDHNGDRIYVGRYEDPSGVNKKGFNIHRHLALRPAYSTAPEILT